MSTTAKPYVAVGLSSPQIESLLDDPALLARLDELPLAYTVVGTERLVPSVERGRTLESSVAGALLASRTRHARFLIATTAEHDHPYNLARRVASLGHLSRGRSGLLLGDSESGAPVPVIARAIRALEGSWPFESVIADRDTGIFVQSDRIEHVDLDGVYRIAGPLTVPQPATGPSVIGWFNGPAVLDVSIAGVIDLTVGDTGTGVLLAEPDRAVGDLLDEAQELLQDARAIPPGGSLRAALDLPTPPRIVGRPAFARPEPLAVSR